jgi:hypothetical protein
MTVSGLLRERDRGRLVVFMLAGNEYTTLMSRRSASGGR